MASLFTGKLKSTIKSKLEEFIVTDNSNIIFEKTKEKDFAIYLPLKVQMEVILKLEKIILK